MTSLLSVTAIGAALVAGIFYAFSTFVMQALGRLAPREGIAAMQSINVVVINPLFFLAFFGTGRALRGHDRRLAAFRDRGVARPGARRRRPVSRRLHRGHDRRQRAAEREAGKGRARTIPRPSPCGSFYLVRWTRWNHVRTAASLAAAACFLIAMRNGVGERRPQLRDPEWPISRRCVADAREDLTVGICDGHFRPQNDPGRRGVGGWTGAAAFGRARTGRTARRDADDRGRCVLRPPRAHRREDGRTPSSCRCGSAPLMRPDDYGALGLAWKSAPTIRSSLERVERYCRLWTDNLTYEIRDRDDGIDFVVHRSGERRLGMRLSNEATIASATSLIRQTSSPRFRPRTVFAETRGSHVDLGPRTLLRLPRPLRLRSRCSVDLAAKCSPVPTTWRTTGSPAF